MPKKIESDSKNSKMKNIVDDMEKVMEEHIKFYDERKQY